MKNLPIPSSPFFPKSPALAACHPGEQAAKAIVTGPGSRDNALKVAFLFSGQGSQYPGMGKALYRTNHTFRNAFDSCDSFLQAYLGISLAEKLYENDKNEMAYGQLALFVVEYALARVWLSWGVKPAVLLGHSAGEYVAACLAGVFPATDALKLIATRERLLTSLPDPGRMAVVFAGAQEVEKTVHRYPGQASIAAINGPANTVISGSREVIDALVRQFRQTGIHARDLMAPYGYHSPLVDPIQKELYAFARTLVYAPAEIPIVSTLTGKLLPGELDARYWCDQIRQPVLFSAAMQTLENKGYHTLLEIGPNPMLLAMARDFFTPTAICLPSLRKGRPDGQQMRESWVRLLVPGLKVDRQASPHPPTPPGTSPGFKILLKVKGRNLPIPKSPRNKSGTCGSSPRRVFDPEEFREDLG